MLCGLRSIRMYSTILYTNGHGLHYLITANSPIQRACPPLTLLSRRRFLYTCGDIRTPARFRLLCLILPFSVIQQAVCTEHGVRSTYPYPCATTDTESVLSRIPDGVRCKANNQPIQCKFLVVNYASSALLEDSKRIDSLTLFICYLLLVSRNEAFRGIPNARATKPRPWKKSKSMSTSFLPSLHQRNHYRRAFCNRKSVRFRATMLPLLFLNTELLLVDTHHHYRSASRPQSAVLRFSRINVAALYGPNQTQGDM